MTVIDAVLVGDALRLVRCVIRLPPKLLGSLNERADADFFSFCMRKVEAELLGGSRKKEVCALESAGGFGVWQNLGGHFAKDSGGEGELD